MAPGKIVIAGAGGHAKVVLGILERMGDYEITGATDPNPDAALGIDILGDDSVLAELAKTVEAAAIGLGSVGDTAPRRRLRATLLELGFNLPCLIHPAASIEPSVSIGDASQIMAGAAVNPGAEIGQGVVVNTGSIIEHDVILQDDVFVGPGATVGGDVIVEDGAFIGIGSTIIQGVRIGSRAVIGAGAVVVKDVPAGITVVGVPARPRN